MIVLAELPELTLDHPAHGLRQLALDLRQPVPEFPLTVHLRDRSLVSKIPHEVGHEERTALGLGVDQGRKIAGKTMTWELEFEVVRDLGLLQELELQLPAQPAGLEIRLDLEERVLRKQHVRRPVGRDHEHVRTVELAGQKAE